MRTKMADGVYEEEGRKTAQDSKMVNETVEMLDIVRKECVNTNGLCSLNSKFYLNGDTGNFGTNFRLNGVGLGVHASVDCAEHVSEFTADFKSLCPSGGDNGRKKRCSDRYDSSESSDSGVATLSSTDCSTSSGTSDITEPGSPYSSPSSAALRSPSSSTTSTSSSAASGSASSSASEESDDSRTGSPAIPQALRHPSSPQPSTPLEPHSPEAPSTPPPAAEDDEIRPPDPWPPSLWTDDRVGRSVFTSSQKRRFHGSGAFKSVVAAKRPKTSPPSTYQGTFQSLLQCFQGKSSSASTPAREEEQDEIPMLSQVRCAESQAPIQPPMARGQGKITEYFKTQMKPPSSSKCGVRKDGRFAGGRINSLVAVEVSGNKVVESGLVDKYFGFSPVESRAGEGVMVAVSSSSSFVPVAAERLESSLSEAKGICASGRVGSVVRGPEAEDVVSNDTPVASVGLVASTPVVTNMPAPILSAPRTIRFPVVQRTSGGGKAGGLLSNGAAESRPSAVCHWSECKQTFDCGSKLMEHLQTKHVNSQVEGSENFVCLWVGCKVYARTSCSRTWLERHVLSHGGNKPFRCIFDGCGQRFSSQTMLERHVNGHFNASNNGNGSMGSGPGGSAGAKRSLDATPNKAFRRNGKKLRYRRRPWSARMFDYFDAGVMEELQHRLVAVAEKELTGQVTPRGDEVLLTSKVLARRTELDGKTKVLLRWFPEDIMPDEWVLESEVKPKCTFPIRTLPPSAHSSLRAALFGASAPKHRRKTKASGHHPATVSLPSSPFTEIPSPGSSQSCSASSSLS